MAKKQLEDEKKVFEKQSIERKENTNDCISNQNEKPPLFF